MKCLKCGNSNPENAAYCQNCNAYLAEPPGMEYLDSFKALILGLFFTGIFYLVFQFRLSETNTCCSFFPDESLRQFLHLYSGHCFWFCSSGVNIASSTTHTLLSETSCFMILYQREFMWRMLTKEFLKSASSCRNKKKKNSRTALSSGVYAEH